MLNDDAMLEIVRQTIADLLVYETVPISFYVRSKFIVSGNKQRGFKLLEQSVEPYLKNYDDNESRPTAWPRHFDFSRWAIFGVFDGAEQKGGATAVCRSPEINMLAGRDDIVCLWDIRVQPECRGQGIGNLLFSAVEDWGRGRGCIELTVETQDINTVACKFYRGLGCELFSVDEEAYSPELNEIQMIWRKRL